MSEREKFIDRWSRRKRKAADESTPVDAKDAAIVSLPSAETNPPAAEVPFDPASLPPIESIGAESDIRAFLRPGVPPELSRAALRRAWSADPAIRDFVGLVENGWDFNNPDAMPGFGPISPGDVARLLARVIGPSPPAKPGSPQQIARETDDFKQIPPREVHSGRVELLPQDHPAPGQDRAPPAADFVQRNTDDDALQANSGEGERLPPSRHRGHGGALPKL
jgi:uncharacterized protein DUF3306